MTRETYIVGFHPESGQWDAQKISGKYSDQHWVFKVVAKDEGRAVAHAQSLVSDLLSKPTAQQMALYRHLFKQSRNARAANSQFFTIDLPGHLKPVADDLVKRSMFMQSHEEQLLVDTRGAAWKAVELHIASAGKPERLPNVLEL